VLEATRAGSGGDHCDGGERHAPGKSWGLHLFKLKLEIKKKLARGEGVSDRESSIYQAIGESQLSQGTERSSWHTAMRKGKGVMLKDR
jgi:hypothetical protein